MDFILSETFEIWDQESSEIGETDNKGFNFQDRVFEGLREVISYIKDNGFMSPSQYPLENIKNHIKPCYVWLSTVDPCINYTTEEQEFKSLHFENISCHNFKLLNE